MQYGPLFALAVLPIFALASTQVSSPDDNQASMVLFTEDNCKGRPVILDCDSACRQNPSSKKCGQKATIPKVCRSGEFRSYYLNSQENGGTKIDAIYVRTDSDKCHFNKNDVKYGPAYLGEQEDSQNYTPGCHQLGQAGEGFVAPLGGIKAGTQATFACTWPGPMAT